MSNGNDQQFDKDIVLAQYDKVIEFAKIALTSAIIINGGAAIALLAFIAGVWKNGIDNVAILSLTLALILFACGVLSAAIATSMGYLSEFNSLHDNHQLMNRFLYSAVGLVILSFLLFFFGILATSLALICYLPQS